MKKHSASDSGSAAAPLLAAQCITSLSGGQQRHLHRERQELEAPLARLGAPRLLQQAQRAPVEPLRRLRVHLPAVSLSRALYKKLWPKIGHF
jgi:hypothetical protein